MSRQVRWPALALAALALASLLAPLVAADPSRIDEVLARRLVPPLGTDALGHFHLLGTDRFGRDLLARTLLAARVSLLVGVVGSLLATSLGVALGAAAAWYGRWWDRFIMSVADALLAVPRLILLLFCVVLWQPGLLTVVVVLTTTGWMSVARLVRSEVQGLRRAGYVESAQVLGVGHTRALWRHAVPNALVPAVVAGTLGVGNAILLESGLAFLGLGVQPPTPSWGNMIAGGRDLIVTAPWVSLTPGLALIATVIWCTLIGERLEDHGREVPGRLSDRA